MNEFEWSLDAEELRVQELLEACLPNKIDRLILTAQLNTLLDRKPDLEEGNILKTMTVLLGQMINDLIKEEKSLRFLSKFTYVIDIIPEAPHLKWSTQGYILQVNASFLTLSTSEKIACFNSAFQEYGRDNECVD